MSTIAATPPRASLVARVLAVPATVAIVLAGLWVTGGKLTNDFTLAMWLSVGWMALAGLGVLAVARRNRSLRWPVLGAYAATALALAVYLGPSFFGDDVVDEQVAAAAATAGGQPAANGNTLLSEGRFEPVRHEARGEAAAIELATGERVLTLTDFEVDNGPDLRVYLVAGPAGSEGEIDDFVDLGALKGNVGDQQYAIPPAVDLERYSTAMIWCRAFSVLFARAELRA